MMGLGGCGPFPRCLLLVFLAIWEARGDACSSPFVKLSTGCYYFSDQAVSWWKASANCRQHDAYLASVESSIINDVLVTEARKLNKSFWLGASDLINEGRWLWESDRRTFLYTAWETGQPNNNNGSEHCLMLPKQFNFKWNDEDCVSNLNYICKKKEPSQRNSDGGQCRRSYQTTCALPFKPWASMCLFFSQNLRATWQKAELCCKFIGGHLAEVHSEHDLLKMRMFLYQINHYAQIHRNYYTNEDYFLWFGASDAAKEGDWKWAESGQSVNSSLWNPQQAPYHDSENKDCLRISILDSSWDNVACHEGYRFLCQATEE